MTEEGHALLPMNANTSDMYPQSMSDKAARSEQVTLQRLEEQIAWYDRRSSRSRICYKFLKTMTITSAAAIPVLTTARLPHVTTVAAALGISIAVLEGIQQLNQYQTNWATYRTTAEALKREKHFYLAQAGPYLKTEDPHALLADRIEAIAMQENSKWLMSQSQSGINDGVRIPR